MVRGWGVGAAMGLLVGTLACSEPAVFTCGGDDDCVLGGVQGQCQDTGSCAYPDDDCTSGLSYPEGAPPDLAGRCVEGGATGGDTVAATDSGGIDDPSTDDATDDATDDTTGGTTVALDDGSTTGDGSTGDTTFDPTTDSTDSSGGARCGPDEVGDSPQEALPVGMCATKYGGVLEQADDVDWFDLGACPSGTAAVEVMVDDPKNAVVCLVPLCEAGELPMIGCNDPAMVLPDAEGNAMGCCGAESFEANYACPNQAVALYVAAASSPDAPPCGGYAFSLTAEEG